MNPATAEPQSAEDCLYFCLDRDNAIIDVGGRTLDDSEQSAARLREIIVGSTIFKYVAGHFTKRFLRAFLDSVRATKREATRMYRCDSPGKKRLMELRAIPLADSELRLEHRILKEEALPHRINFRTEVERLKATFVRCSNCNSLRPIRGGDWREPECWPATEKAAPVIYSVCPACRAGIKRFQLPADERFNAPNDRGEPPA